MLLLRSRVRLRVGLRLILLWVGMGRLGLREPVRLLCSRRRSVAHHQLLLLLSRHRMIQHWCAHRAQRTLTLPLRRRPSTSPIRRRASM